VSEAAAGGVPGVWTLQLPTGRPMRFAQIRVFGMDGVAEVIQPLDLDPQLWKPVAAPDKCDHAKKTSAEVEQPYFDIQLVTTTRLRLLLRPPLWLAAYVLLSSTNCLNLLYSTSVSDLVRGPSFTLPATSWVVSSLSVARTPWIAFHRRRR